MTLDLLDSSLKRLASDGTMDFSKWPEIFDPLIERFETIIQTEFPPVYERPKYPDTFAQADNTPNQSSFVAASASNNNYALHDAPDSSSAQRPVLATSLLEQIHEIESHLRTRFQASPPHTIQRLAELLLHPILHYRTLPAYIRAIEKVVSVSSSVGDFPISPMPAVAVSLADIVLSNDSADNGQLDSANDALAGATLTPIPWLHKSSTGASTPRSDMAVTNSPRGSVRDFSDSSSRINSSPEPHGEHNSGSQDSSETAHGRGHSHARGPSIVDVNDVGLQHGQSIEIPITSEDSPNAEVNVDTTTDGDATIPESEKDANQTQPGQPSIEAAEAKSKSLDAPEQSLEMKEYPVDDEIDMGGVGDVHPDTSGTSEHDQKTEQAVTVEISQDEQKASWMKREV